MRTSRLVNTMSLDDDPEAENSQELQFERNNDETKF